MAEQLLSRGVSRIVVCQQGRMQMVIGLGRKPFIGRIRGALRSDTQEAFSHRCEFQTRTSPDAEAERKEAFEENL